MPIDLPTTSPLLLVFAEGVGVDSCTRTADGTGIWQPLLHDSEDPIRDFLACHTAAPLRDLGIAVDQAGVLLRPRFRSDEQVVAALGRRPTGPAPATILCLTDVARAAARDGLKSPAYEAAVQSHGDLIQGARSLLRAGDHPETWYVALGAMQPTARTFDLVRTLRRRLASPLARQITGTVAPHMARLRCASTRALDLLRTILERRAYRELGDVRTGPGEILFLPRDGVALGARPCRARLPRADEARAFVSLPAAPRSELPLDLPGLAARFCLRAAQWPVAPLPAPLPVSSRAFAPSPDLLSLLQAGREATAAPSSAPAAP